MNIEDEDRRKKSYLARCARLRNLDDLVTAWARVSGSGSSYFGLRRGGIYEYLFRRRGLVNY